MDKSLATNGLGEFNLPSATTDSLGVDTNEVKKVVSELDKLVSEINKLKTSLDSKGTQIMSGWEGAGKDAFKKDFAPFCTEFAKVPESIKSLKEWADELSNGYADLDNQMEEKLKQILGVS